jgi:MarR family transcriptional regulator, organic hydroperoxide resistance regulator
MNNHHHHPLVPLPPEPGDAIDAVTAGAFHSLGKVFHLHRQAMQRRLSNPETHHGELISMRLLARTEGMSQRDLAETLHLSRSRITSILQGLEKAGAVRREPDANDQRVTRVFLTDEGRRREMENRADFEDYINKTIGALSEADRVEMTRILDLVSDHIAELVCAGTKEQEGRVAL